MKMKNYKKASLMERLNFARKAFFKRYYEGASYSKDSRNWNLVTHTSANVENRIAGQILSNRARSLIQNSPYAHRALHCIVNNTVGSGIIPQIRCEDEDKRLEILKYWKEWAETSAIDIEGRQNFYSLQAQALRTIVSDGECLVRIIPAKNNSKIPSQLQLLEPEYLDSYKEYKTETGYIISGIEFKKTDQNRFDRHAYWLFKEHPGGFINLQSYQSYSALSEPIPASEIIHVYRHDRPGAVRGVSWFHPCILALQDLHDFQQAVLRQQKLANCFTVFVRKSDSIGADFAAQAEELSHLEPGLIYHLGLGEDISFAAPPPPATNYTEYCNHILKGIAASLGITFECLGDLSTVNYSSGRMGWIEMARNIDSWRFQMLIPQLCEPVWQIFSKTMTIYGFDMSDVEIGWTPPKREMLNVSEEMEAMQIGIRTGLITYSEALRSFGEDPDSHMKELSQDFKKLKEYGLKLECDPSNEISKPNNLKAVGKEAIA